MELEIVKNQERNEVWAVPSEDGDVLIVERLKLQLQFDRLEIVGLPEAWVNEAAVNGDTTDLKAKHFQKVEAIAGLIGLTGCLARFPINRDNPDTEHGQTQEFFEHTPSDIV